MGSAAGFPCQGQSLGLDLVGIFTCLLFGWSKGGREVKERIARTSKWFPTGLWWWFVRLVAPLILIVFLLLICILRFQR